ncbi:MULTISPECIES: mechanosensitive ion channel family protein [Methanobacterium]|jgi:small conductance mechanosensitive channel|uniref:Mechanosensitive ion channel family protein n=1 Tax=Methanobacterium subterraneum TaxID=59277 RepID=A0A2H4VCU0_9EURY|nr:MULTISPECIES: mechanosensitive ion channel family protein [Methanobacterium]MBW4257947.1 mechanosensitive ion channel family protein [Methanobacterium sp. YSL]AUB55918.1 mechanosensitive ion channel protein MscS [Methanobacterium subterraneum]AUB57068.1 mechanosensitive ion channel protein MscS [Methanobacterium sp. MZ-A1]AUB60210.1 mechanosensitive ion channel protein MscS [Methanobacterium subterraneum]NMO08380.1 mechanosensitive ion channel family protein [Methanobacterium subterraneum]
MLNTDPLYLDLIKIAVILLSSFIIIKWAIYIIKKTGNRFNFEPTLIQVLIEIIKYSIIAVAITVVLKEVGWDISAIVLSLGIVGIAVGFAARDTLSNFIAGLFILADKSFRVGDIIELSGQSGKVIKLGLRVTTIKTEDNKIITIPNSTFSKNIYINSTAQETRRVGLDINIPYEMELEVVVNSLVETASNCKWTLHEPKPNVLIKEMTDTGIKATLNVWVCDPWKVATFRSQLALKVKGLLVIEDVS